MYKIILKDNFNRESISDTLIEENIKTLDEAQQLADEFNNTKAGYSDFYKVVPQEQEL